MSRASHHRVSNHPRSVHPVASGSTTVRSTRRRRVPAVAVGIALAVGSLAGCNGSDGGGTDDDPTPVGGINGPARVDPDSGGADNDQPSD